MSLEPPRRRWFRFTLGQLFTLTLGIAIGFVPLRLWELYRAPAPLLGLQVRIYEVSQSEFESLGLAADPSQPIARPFNAAHLQRIDDLKETGALKVVVEPMLVTTSGRPASFHVGGELPVPADSNGVLAVEYREFGTRVEFVPTLLRSGIVQMQLRVANTSVEKADDADAAPGFRSTSSQMDVELRLGESLAAANLLQTENRPGFTTIVIATINAVDRGH